MTLRWISPARILWTVVELAAMTVSALVMVKILALAGAENVGKSAAPATVLLSVAVAIVTQLWVKLNDLSGLASLSVEERNKLSDKVRAHVRALVWLVVFFVTFIFFVLATSALAAAKAECSEALLIGVGAGFGACLTLISGVLVDLNEVAEYRWKVETSDASLRRRKEVLEELREQGEDFQGDQNIQGYKHVVE